MYPRDWHVLCLFLHILAFGVVTASALQHRPLRQRSSNPLGVEQGLVDRERKVRYVLGSDDCGQGSLAGPIVTASICITVPLSTYDPIAGVDDSKRLDQQERERIYRSITERPDQHKWTTSVRHNMDPATTLPQATLDCFRDSIESLLDRLKETEGDGPAANSVYYSIVDGHQSPAGLSLPSRPWKRGDETVYTVALASIVARVVYDRHMETVAHRLYPEYGFDVHHGYPTRQHLQALDKYGPCPIHRPSCRPVSRRKNMTPETIRTRRHVLTSSMFLLTATASLGRPSTAAAFTDPRTGASLPDPGEIEAAIPRVWDDEDTDPTEPSMTRLDSTQDAVFYDEPRFVEHVDDQAVRIMTQYISDVVLGRMGDGTTPIASVLDLCSSWTSHIDEKMRERLQRVVGLGMNEKELKANPSLTEWLVQDLNHKPRLPFEDTSFDVVFLQLSIDYLLQPLTVCREIGRVLRRGGSVHVLFSNRYFLTKVVSGWAGTDDVDHAYAVGAYLHSCQKGLFMQIEAQDLSVRSKGRDRHIEGDPVFVVRAIKE